jgi:hypothetical protein
MSDTIVVYKGRTNILTVNLGIDVSGDTITSEIRTPSGTLIATWEVVFDSDGSNGELILTLDDLITIDIAYPSGLMDIKRMSGGEPLSVFDKPLEVEFRDTVTQ